MKLCPFIIGKNVLQKKKKEEQLQIRNVWPLKKKSERKKESERCLGK